MDWQSADPSLVIRHLQGAPLQPVGPQGITVEGAVFEDLVGVGQWQRTRHRVWALKAATAHP